MNNRINSMTIKSLRGIRDLELKDFGDVNIILGDNNSGKTTVLEAIKLFKREDFSNVITTLRERTINSLPTIDDLVNLFNNKSNTIDISIDSSIGKKNIFLDYSLKDIVFNKEIFLGSQDDKNNESQILSFLIEKGKIDGTTIPQINGTYKIDDKEEKYSYVSLDFFYNLIRKNEKEDLLKIISESPYDHFSVNSHMISSIKENEAYYRVFIEVLRLFDESINKVELLTKTNYITNSQEPEIYIQRGDENPMPLKNYGDGIKKVVCISAMIARSVNGILLIDEIETSLHHNYYLDVLFFLIKVSKKYNIQLFITTHSSEIIDVFSKYNSDNSLKSAIKFYTLKKKENKTSSRTLNDKEVIRYNNLGLEVRS